MDNAISYTCRSLELRAAEYYASIRKPESEWKTFEDFIPLLIEYEHRIVAGDYIGTAHVLELIDFEYRYLWGNSGRSTETGAENLKQYLHQSLLAELSEKLVVHLIDPGPQMRILAMLAHHYRNLGNIDKAIQIHEVALSIASETGNKQSIGALLGSLGSIYRSLGRFERAIEYYKQALDIARSNGDSSSEALQLNRLGYTYHFLGDFEQSLKVLNLALELNIALSDNEGITICRAGIGVAYSCLGDFEKAHRFYKNALEEARQIRHRWGEMISLGYLGDTSFELGQIDKAICFYEQGMSIARELGYRREESLNFCRLAKVALFTGEITQAQHRCEDALTLNYPATSWLVRLLLGTVRLRQGGSDAHDVFSRAVQDCWMILDENPNFYQPIYGLATALVGQVICDPHWADPIQREPLLAPALTEYYHALDITSAAGVVRDALRDLELIRAAGIQGLEPVFALLEEALNDNTPPS